MGDHYELLGVDPTATGAEVHAAFRRAANEFHPDHQRPGSTTAPAARMAELNDAWWTLRDPARRAAYDASRISPAGATATRVTGGPRPTDRATVRPVHRAQLQLFVLTMALLTVILVGMFIIAMSQSGW